MVDKIVENIHGENLDSVMKEYETMKSYYLNKNINLDDNKNSVLLLRSIDKVMSSVSLEQADHFERVADLANLFAKEMGLNVKDTESLVAVAKYHDIGKINISKDILNKPGKLNDEEWQIIREHPVYSYNILKNIPDFEEVALGALSHHERFDGTGYPANLAGEDIPLLSRAMSIIDTYDVLVNGRVYRQPISEAEALKEINRCVNTQFDPFLVKVFENLIEKKNEKEVVKEVSLTR